jgi:hypothetical protein
LSTHPYTTHHPHDTTHRNVSRVKKLGVGPQDLQRLVSKGQDAIDLLLVWYNHDVYYKQK